MRECPSWLITHRRTLDGQNQLLDVQMKTRRQHCPAWSRAGSDSGPSHSRQGAGAATPGHGLLAPYKTECPTATRPRSPAPRRSPTGAESVCAHGDLHTSIYGGFVQSR